MAAKLGRINLIKYSFIYFLENLLLTNWGSSVVSEDYPQTKDADLPRVCVTAKIINHTFLEMGTMQTVKMYSISLEIFGKYKGQDVDIANDISPETGGIWATISLIDFNTAMPKLKSGAVNTAFNAATQKVGSFTVETCDIEPLDLGSDVAEIDKYRTNIYITVKED